MNQEDPRSDLWTFFWWEAQTASSYHPSRISTIHATSLEKKKTPHLSNIRDLKNNPTPVKHSWSQKKNTPHLSNIRDLKKTHT